MIPIQKRTHLFQAYPIILGALAIVSAELCFYTATIIARRAAALNIALSGEILSFGRFLLGFFVILCTLCLKQKMPRPQHYRVLIGRAIFNTIAVTTFFKAVEVTSVAEGNILNMTYPVFLAILSWIVFREQRDVWGIVMVVVAFGGIVLVLAPAEFRIVPENLWGLTSGVTAAIAILCLSLAQQHNDTDTILLIMFGGGAVILGVIFWNDLFIPTAQQGWYLLACGGMGVLGQYLLTTGYRYVTAVQGGMLSLSRILYAAFLGPLLTTDPALSLAGIIGAALILGANAYFIVKKTHHP